MVEAWISPDSQVHSQADKLTTASVREEVSQVKRREGEEGEEEEDDDKSLGAAPAQQPEEVEGVQLLQAGRWLSWAILSTVDIPREEGEMAMGLIHPVALLRPLGTVSLRLQPERQGLILLDFHKPIDHEDNTSMSPKDIANADSYKGEDCAAMLDMRMGNGTSRLEKAPSLGCLLLTVAVWLGAAAEGQARLTGRAGDQLGTLQLPRPRVAVTMWRAIISSNRTAEKVLPELLCVLEDWPLHSTSTSDKDNSDVFSLAATRAVWEIIHLPQGPERMILYFPRLFVALLFQVFSSTEQMPVEVNAFWRRCQHKHCLPTNPNRFALLTMKALLCHLEYEDVVSEVERECGWDTLLNTDTRHSTVGLLARAMLRVSEPLCYRIARYLFRLLHREEARWEVAAMAFLVEVSLVVSTALLRPDPPLCPLADAAARESMMELVQEEGERQGLKDCVRQSLLPLFYHMYDENQFVAEASWETLLQATIFLKKWNLQQLLESEELWRFGKCLVRVASKPKTLLEQALCPQYPLCSLWPLLTAVLITNSLLPTHYSPLVCGPAGSYPGFCASPCQAANRAPTQLWLGIKTALRLPVE
ncbi:hypothetical protein IHE44_0011168 [Lamprotornis superbus]|uniref:Maestro heat-like repeat-containing protein family member 6 n=1 Tax=Lamprotornis superbus TaxID=245042 RepID=A0A835TLK3_9PASS|nr:hypothetical protein IHE44_0011168 [Lamprotornis superbus]